MNARISFVCAAIAAALLLPSDRTVAQVDNSWMEYKNPYVNEQGNLANPNRTTDEILALSRELSTDALTFTPEEIGKQEDGSQNKVERLRKNFGDHAWEEYIQYMRDSRFMDMVYRNNYHAATIVDGDITLVNSGPIAGVYRWVVQVPLLVTFHQVTRLGESMPVTSDRFQLTMQIGREKSGEGKDGMVIDSWKMSQEQSSR